MLVNKYEWEVLRNLSDILYYSKFIKNKELIKLKKEIYKTIENMGLNTDPHDFVDFTNIIIKELDNEEKL